MTLEANFMVLIQGKWVLPSFLIYIEN